MDRNKLNKLKDHLLSGVNYCKIVYNGGLETAAQFYTFKALCQNYVDFCNYWCNSMKPALGWLQYNKMKQHNEFYNMCELAVLELKNMIAEFQSILDKQAEEAETMAMLEARARVEHAVAVELRDADHKNRLELSRVHPIGYCININQNKDGNTGSTN